MRFGVPRSFSPSPERKSSRSRFRAPSYDSSDYDDLSSDDDDPSIDLDISVDSSCSLGAGVSSEDENKERDSAEEILLPLDKLRLSERDPEEKRAVMETVASIRNHVRHVDLYEQWQSQTRKDAFHTARRQQSTVIHQLRAGQRKTHVSEQQQLDAQRTKEIDFLRVSLEAHRNSTAVAERQLREKWRERDRQLWERIEKAIKEEEEKVRAAQEAERLKREEEERIQREEEERRKAEEQKRKIAEEEERKKRIEEKLMKEMEEMERKEQEEKAQQAKAQDEGSMKLRESTGMMYSDDLWKLGLQHLKFLKTVVMRAVKGQKAPDPEPAGYRAPPAPPLKKLWSAQRRKITPKIGQLTDDSREIARITDEIKAIVAPIPNMPKPDDAQYLHYALLSSFAKTIILQAETEVTAHKAQAGPLARVAVALIATYPILGNIFWAKLCERAGCWASGIAPVMLEDETQESLSEKQKRKRWGARLEESQEEKATRLSGVMRLYFHMLFVSLDMETREPLPLPFRPGRYWLYLAQLLNNKAMLGKPVAPEIIYVALDEGGLHAKNIWGKQFIKMLQLIYEGIRGDGKTRFGGDDVLAQASRARCQLEIEKIMAR
ncbi:GLE1-like protein-domain-containing protein [Phellopilus nigrolimitatus]|nr:GLE1-like protein-domain-containing protein [Phellopilus nigrolimitatus]